MFVRHVKTTVFFRATFQSFFYDILKLLLSLRSKNFAYFDVIVMNEIENEYKFAF